MARIGIDTGGTFTDVVRLGPKVMAVHKVPSTPAGPAQAVLDGLALARRDPDEVVDVVHGTTVGLNAVLTGSLARVAFVTNRGFEDLIEIGRQDRPDIYDLSPERPPMPVPRRLRFGVGARRDHRGAKLAGFASGELKDLVDALGKAKVEAVAIGLLHSPVDPRDERTIAVALRHLGVPVTCSAELSPHPTEFERFVTAILNAGMAPVMGRYMERLQREVGPGQLRLMRSSGGILAPEVVAREPARAAFSGPAGGVLATAALVGADGGVAAAFDMGGTSTDVCLVGGPARGEALSHLGGLPLALPAADVHTVGCGGGSLAYVDPGGALRVGPESAGADPGPACYGVGDQPTVTDAHMALGHMGSETLLRGAFPVDPARSVRAVETLGRRLGLDPAATARGILEIAEVNMMRALLKITAERAVDPATVTLVAYGGAGGLHAAGLMGRLGIRRALVPVAPGAFSAVGLALAGESEEFAQAVLKTLGPDLESELRQQAEGLVEEAKARVANSGRARAAVAVRYAGQGTSLEVPLVGRGTLRHRFAAAHQILYGFDLGDRPVEVVQLQVRVEQRRGAGSGLKPVLRTASASASASASPRRRWSPAGRRHFDVWDRDGLEVGRVLDGPCLIEEHTGVTVLPSGFTAAIGTLAIEIGRRE